MNSDWAIERAKPIAEMWRPALAVALKASGQEWRSTDLQVAFLIGEIAAAIDSAVRDTGGTIPRHPTTGGEGE